jgi:hypothetical protein
MGLASGLSQLVKNLDYTQNHGRRANECYRLTSSVSPALGCEISFVYS